MASLTDDMRDANMPALLAPTMPVVMGCGTFALKRAVSPGASMMDTHGSVCRYSVSVPISGFPAG